MLNQKYLSNFYAVKTALAFILCSLLILNCGKRKPPLPPIERVSQRIEISGIQRGNTVALSWTLPEKNASGKSVANISRADIYRLAEPLSAPPTLSAEEFAARSSLLASVPVTAAAFTDGKFTYDDVLQFAGQPARLRYAVRFVNDAGQKAAFSNFLLIEPTAKSAASPTDLQAQVSQESVLLSWNAPQRNVDGSEPVNLLGYNIYRISDGKTKLLNGMPIQNNNFTDAFFEFGVQYEYFVRTISLGSNGEPLESLGSNELRIKPADIFPPQPPSAVTIAAAPENLSIFFAVNLEKDIAGYKIYRTNDPGQPKSEWLLVTPEKFASNTFQDKSVESGKTYYYYLTATDTAGNVSAPSEIISETAP